MRGRRRGPSPVVRSGTVWEAFGGNRTRLAETPCSETTRSPNMETMERDPAYIAQHVKFLRKMHGFTQENLADAAGITTRTVEKIESGRHAPEEQTLRSIARAFSLDVKIFA